MTDVLNDATSLAGGNLQIPPLKNADSDVGAVPTTFATAAQNTATAVQNAASTAASAANAAASTVLNIKDAWSSPSNCLHSKYQFSSFSTTNN